ncbi:hypothetical protein H6F67_16285 [Microcoleus sp. FACHB-1515]|uniref:hypothetical protein n=1 Tax=Cyanophyceae TaxID=3028117 RepID=UPI001684FD18|nr:hypothetical protein [Microcoleus sp. FACHB-1515]MBD2091403.1 hypothetical protein [Microcoleus sp. FACHB-1515]
MEYLSARIRYLDKQGSKKMAPLNRFEAGLARLQNSDCEVDATVQKVRQEYEKQADSADQRLQEKQAREQVRFFG